MAPAPFTAEPGNWFLRGVQSAVFYYVSFTPCLEYQHKRTRRREAKAQAQSDAEVITTQPGIVRQPGPFQTNEAWAEELMLGPGPPRGWKKDTLLQKLQKKVSQGPQKSESPHPSPSISQLHPQPTESSTTPSTQSTVLPTDSSTRASSSPGDTVTRENAHPSGESSNASPARPPRERRLSNAMENIKDSLRTTLHPPKWNWKRYDREDEILGGVTERMSRMWNRATSGIHHEETGEPGEGEHPMHGRKRATTNESDRSDYQRYDYHRARHPEINDLHPPVVSQLPATRADAAWMLLPPPSAAVMAAKKRPAAELEMRWPLCIIGGLPKEMEPKRSLAMTRSVEQFDEREMVDLSGTDIDIDSIRSGESPSERSSPQETKRFSDPMVKPRPGYAAPTSPIAGDLFVPKRRASWQFHYLIPSKNTMQW